MLTYAMARPFVHVRYIVLANLVLQREAVPEPVIQYACTPESLANAAQAVMPLLRARVQRQLRRPGSYGDASRFGGEAPFARPLA